MRKNPGQGPRKARRRSTPPDRGSEFGAIKRAALIAGALPERSDPAHTATPIDLLYAYGAYGEDERAAALKLARLRARLFGSPYAPALAYRDYIGGSTAPVGSATDTDIDAWRAYRRACSAVSALGTRTKREVWRVAGECALPDWFRGQRVAGEGRALRAGLRALALAFG